MMSTAGSDPDLDLGPDLEEGELSGSDVEEGTYIPLERPDSLVAQLNPASIMNMQIQDDHSDESCYDTSSSGSDSDTKKTQAKRVRARKPKTTLVNKTADEKRSKYSVWCKTLQEDVLTEDMNSCEFLSSRNYGIESYDYNLQYRLENSLNSLKTKDDQSALEDNNLRNNLTHRHGLKRTKQDRKNVKLRLGKRESIESDLNDRGASRDLGNLSVTTDNSVEDIAREIAVKLNEDKDGLLLKVVTFAGKERAIEIFQETKRIEQDGGMMVMNGTRRRTPGGVYLFLVKGDDKLTKDIKGKIFQEDKQNFNRIKKRAQARNREKKVQQLKQSLTDSDLPALLTRSEQALQSSSVGTSERNDTDGIVSNPPPSPVTDGRDGSSDTDTQKSPQRHVSQNQSINVERDSPEESVNQYETNYDDDFLDLRCGDDMDLF